MTKEEARIILGLDAKGISDEQLQGEINTANLFKVLFFDWLKKKPAA